MDIRDFIDGEEFESKKYEFKEIVSHKNYEKWAKTFVAFANTEGGKIFFGVDDDEVINGLDKETIKKDILYINEICDRKISPRIKYDIEKIKINDDSFVLAVDIKKSEKSPVWLLRSDEEEVIYVRKDGQSVIARGEEIEEIVLNSKRKPFDEIITDTSYDDVTFDKLNYYYQKNNQTDVKVSEKLLISKNAMNNDGYLTEAGLIFADGAHNPNCNVSCRLWPGLSKGDSVMLDRKNFSGDLLSVYDFAKNYISLYTKTGLIKKDDGSRDDIISYPERALNEAIINALAHRDYYINGTQIDIDIFLDRIQISSPGKFMLPGNAKEYSLRQIPSTRRNKNICMILEMCKLMESSGTGFEKIADEYEPFDDKFSPEIYSDPAHFVITLKNLTYSKDTTGKTQENKDIKFEFKAPRTGNREYDYKILEFCMDVPRTRNEIQEFIQLSDRKYFVANILNPLLDKELLLTTQEATNAPNQKYYTNKSRLRIIVE